MTTAASVDAQLAALMGQAEERTNRGTAMVDLPVGVHRIRILPNKNPAAIAWWKTYGTHWLKNPNWVPGGQARKGAFFVCNHNSYEKPCKICDAVNRDKKSLDPVIKTMAGDAYSGARHIANFINMASVVPGQKPKVEVLRLTTGFRNILFQMARFINLRFFDLNANYVMTVEVKPVPNTKKKDYKILQAEQPTPSGVEMADLFDLDEVISSELSNAQSPDVFTGDWANPVPTGPVLAGPTAPGAIPLAAPVQQIAPPAVAPVAAPAYAAPAAPPAPPWQPGIVAVAQPAVAPVAPVAPVAAPQPVYAPQPGAFAPAGLVAPQSAPQPVYAAPAAPVAVAPQPQVIPVAQPAPAGIVMAPAPVAQPVQSVVMPAAAPAAAPVPTDDLEAKLLRMVS